MPPGIQPPIIVQFNASSVPVLQLSLSSDQLNEQQLYDYGIYQMRQALAPIPGITLPTPYGGKYRQIMVDLDPDALRARGISPSDVLNAVNAESLTLPSGDAKLGDQQFIVKVNATRALDRRAEPDSDQEGRRRHRLSIRRRACARRLGGAAEHRARRGQAIGPADHHQERQRLDARRRQSRQGGAARDPEGGAARHEHQAAVRSVGVRAERHQQRAARRRDRRRA